VFVPSFQSVHGPSGSINVRALPPQSIDAAKSLDFATRRFCTNTSSVGRKKFLYFHFMRSGFIVGPMHITITATYWMGLRAFRHCIGNFFGHYFAAYVYYIFLNGEKHICGESHSSHKWLNSSLLRNRLLQAPNYILTNFYWFTVDYLIMGPHLYVVQQFLLKAGLVWAPRRRCSTTNNSRREPWLWEHDVTYNLLHNL